MKLDAPESYELRLEVVQRRSDLPDEPPAESHIAANQGAERGERLDWSPPMIAAARNYVAEVWEAWNEFWFTPTSPSTLSAIRVLAGAMLLYTHLVWSFDLTAFFGPNGWLPADLMQAGASSGERSRRPGPVDRFAPDSCGRTSITSIRRS